MVASAGLGGVGVAVEISGVGWREVVVVGVVVGGCERGGEMEGGGFGGLAGVVGVVVVGLIVIVKGADGGSGYGGVGGDGVDVGAGIGVGGILFGRGQQRTVAAVAFRLRSAAGSVERKEDEGVQDAGDD